jgi:hypothetical protein
VKVENYGRAYYYPSQETALLIDLLKSGHRPNMVVFLDGVNWSDLRDVPFFYKEAKRQFFKLQFLEKPADDQSDVRSLLQRLHWIPLVRLAAVINHRLFGTDQVVTPAQSEAKADAHRVDHIVNLFQQNRAIAMKVCVLYSVKCLFLLQPHAVADYPVELYRRPLPKEFYAWRGRAKEFYDRMRTDQGYIYLGDLFKTWGVDRKTVIDELHYSPPFSRFLAEQIAGHIDLRRLAPREHLIDETAATGMSRLDSKKSCETSRTSGQTVCRRAD